MQPVTALPVDQARRALARLSKTSLRSHLSPASQGGAGLAADESAALLEFLFCHSREPEFTFHHRWRGGDVLFWDNRITQHYAVADCWPRRRRMHRATIWGNRPV